ncbi:MAG: hypothetical protein K5666_03065 [Bacilli bacterium]|nr:hypothetical protein [Bacilli bacterium]
MNNDYNTLAGDFLRVRLTGVCEETYLKDYFNGDSTYVRYFSDIIVMNTPIGYVEIVSGIPIPVIKIEDFSDYSVYPLIMNVPHTSYRGELLDMDDMTNKQQYVTIADVKEYKSSFDKQERRKELVNFIKACRKSMLKAITNNKRNSTLPKPRRLF